MFIAAWNHTADQHDAATQPLGRQQRDGFSRIDRQCWFAILAATPFNGERLCRRRHVDRLGQASGKTTPARVGMLRHVLAHHVIEALPCKIGITRAQSGGKLLQEAPLFCGLWRVGSDRYHYHRHRGVQQRLPQGRVLVRLGRTIEEDVEPDCRDTVSGELVDQRRKELRGPPVIDKGACARVPSVMAAITTRGSIGRRGPRARNATASNRRSAAANGEGGRVANCARAVDTTRMIAAIAAALPRLRSMTWFIAAA